MASNDDVRVVRAGLAYKIVVWGAAIVVGATLLMLLNQPFDMIITDAKQQTGTTAAANGIGYLEMAYDGLPFVILAFAGFGIMVRAWVEQEAA